MSPPIENLLQSARLAQTSWAQEPIAARLQAIAKLRGLLVETTDELLSAIHRPCASDAEKLASEILPLADACRFVTRHGKRILRTQRSSSWHGRWWMGRVGVEIHRDPWGVVFILGPSNYPLFLPAVQSLQALAAGNAVIIKPAPGHEAILECWQKISLQAGIPSGLLQLCPSDIESAQFLLNQGVDKVLLTGSATTGRHVLKSLANTLTPSTMELSGCDAVFLLEDADLDRAANCIAYALRLNGGATCIAPRRVFVPRVLRERFLESLRAALTTQAPNPQDFRIPRHLAEKVQQVAHHALASGASLLLGDLDGAAPQFPIVLSEVSPEMEAATSDIFAPLLSLLTVRDAAEALEFNSRCRYALGASVFGRSQQRAQEFAAKIDAGCIVINDCIVPTADPRVPFGGRHESGWGVTRGAEGLLEMTQIKTVCSRYGSWLPHLSASSQDINALRALAEFMHARSLTAKFRALRRLANRPQN